MPEPTPTAKPSVAIPDHELIRPIGRGSYGEVWLARNVLGEYRAVKVIRRESFDGNRPVERELEGIQKYEPISRTHEHQVHILHIGRFVDGFYYVMELADDAAQPRVSGCELEVSGSIGSAAGEPETRTLKPETYSPKTLRSEVQRRGRVPIAECRDLGLKLTDALAHLHGHGLVHRDVKPSNIIFVRGQPQLADIGLVASTDSSMSCVGTEGFLPPEGPGKPQADLYALGKVLYEISTGRDRHDFPELPTMLRDDPQRRALEEFNEVILKACEPDVRRRYATADAMHADLELLHAGKSLQQIRRRERRWADARKVVVVAALAAAVILLVSLRWGRPREVSRQLPVRLAIDEARFWRDPFMPRQFDFSPDGEHIVFSGLKHLSIWEAKTRVTRRLVLTGIGDWAPAAGAIVTLPKWAPDSHQFVIRAQRRVGGSQDAPIWTNALFLVNAGSGAARRLAPDFAEVDQVNDLCWRPDGESITCSLGSKRLITISQSGAGRAWKESDFAGATSIRLGDYSADGAWLLVSSVHGNGDHNEDQDVWAVPHLGGASQRLTQTAGMDAFPTWGPDFKSIYYVSAGGREGSETWGIWKIAVNRKTMNLESPAVEVFSRKGAKFLHPKFVAAGQTLAYAGMELRTDVWIGELDALERATIPVRGGQDPALSADGQTIYFVGERPDQHGVFAINRGGDSESFRKITELTPLVTGGTRSGLNISPDGQLLALLGHDGKRRGIFVIPTAGGEPRLLEDVPEPGASLPIWSPDGNWLAYAVGEQLVRLSRDTHVRESLATLPRWQGSSVRWSPNGTHIAAFGSTITNIESEDSSVYVLTLDDKTLRKITSNSENQWKEGLEWHPSGEYLTYMIYGPESLSAQIRRAYPDGRATELMIQQADHWDYLGVWAADGRRFFFTSSANQPGEKSIHLYHAQTAQITHGLWGGRMAGLPRWSRDGRSAVWDDREPLRYFEVLQDFH